MSHQRKSAVIEAMLGVLEARIQEAQSAREGLTKSRDTASKSTAGDKHETGRAMMEAELSRAEDQLQKALRMRNELKQLPTENLEVIGQGAWVQTNLGEFMVSIGIGRIVVDETPCFALSGGSPLGQVLLGERVGGSCEFQGRRYDVQAIH